MYNLIRLRQYAIAAGVLAITLLIFVENTRAGLTLLGIIGFIWCLVLLAYTNLNKIIKMDSATANLVSVVIVLILMLCIYLATK